MVVIKRFPHAAVPKETAQVWEFFHDVCPFRHPDVEPFHHKGMAEGFDGRRVAVPGIGSPAPCFEKIAADGYRINGFPCFHARKHPVRVGDFFPDIVSVFQEHAGDVPCYPDKAVLISFEMKDADRPGFRVETVPGKPKRLRPPHPAAVIKPEQNPAFVQDAHAARAVGRNKGIQALKESRPLAFREYMGFGGFR